MTKSSASVTPQSLAVFLAYAKDAPNWSGNPLVGGNVGGTKEERGNLTQLKRAGLITTFVDEGETWITFTDAGHALAVEHGFTLYCSLRDCAYCNPPDPDADKIAAQQEARRAEFAASAPDRQPAVAETMPVTVSAAKPVCSLIGEDGNVFNIIARVSRTLKSAGMSEQAAEFQRRAFASDSYAAVLNLVHEYVEVA